MRPAARAATHPKENVGKITSCSAKLYGHVLRPGCTAKWAQTQKLKGKLSMELQGNNDKKINIENTNYFLPFFRLLLLIGKCKSDIDKNKACLRVWGSLLNTYPQSLSCDHYETIGGTVYILRLETVDLIDDEHHQKCLLVDNYTARHESWPLMFLVSH